MLTLTYLQGDSTASDAKNNVIACVVSIERICITPTPVLRRACLSVCLFVRMHISETADPHFVKFTRYSTTSSAFREHLCP